MTRTCVTCSAPLAAHEGAVCDGCMRPSTFGLELVAILLFIAAIVGVACLVTSCAPAPPPPWHKPMSITWTCTVDVNAPKWVNEGAWDLPAHAEKTGEEQRVHHHHNWTTHEPGFCGKYSFQKGYEYGFHIDCPKDHSEPVYATWHTYQIKRDVLSRRLVARGPAPTCPTVDLAGDEHVAKTELNYAVSQ